MGGFWTKNEFEIKSNPATKTTLKQYFSMNLGSG
jgi:hypothetical protein